MSSNIPDTPLNEQELRELLHNVESDRSERKESISDKEKIHQAICAFANDLPNYGKPGILFIGAKNDGTCANLPITDELLLTLSKMKDDGNITPFPTMVVAKQIIDGCTLAIVTVYPSLDPPVRYKGVCWIRVGPRRDIATAEEEIRLSEKRRSGDLPHDLQPTYGAVIDDLDVNFFIREYLPQAVGPATLIENHRRSIDQMKSLRFLDNSENPTNLGILVLGKDPRRFIPGAYIQFVRINGVNIGDPILDQEEIGGNLLDMLRILDDKISAHITVSSSLTDGPIEIKKPDYPKVALQQITRNAILHRTYEHTNSPIKLYWFDDRIEIISPGGPYGHVNPENFGEPGITDYRNPHIAEAMKVLGYVQRFGFGLVMARSELEKNNNPPYNPDIRPGYILITIMRRL
jgi:ATP-dependent DNA helicase RecG